MGLLMMWRVRRVACSKHSCKPEIAISYDFVFARHAAIRTTERNFKLAFTQVPRGLWFCDRCVKNKNKEQSEIGCTACDSPFDDEKLLYCDGPGIDGSGCEGERWPAKSN